MFESRTRPCLLYQIKRCSAPCVGLISEPDYAAAVSDAADFLSGRTTHIQTALAADMEAASQAMEFERAAALRDRIRALTQVQTAQGINPRGVAEADVIALHVDGGQACVQVFFIRANQNWGNHDFYPRISGDEDLSEVMEAFVGQFYSGREPPRQLLAVARSGRSGADGSGPGGKGGPQGRDPGAATGRKGRAGIGRGAQCPRKPRPPHVRDRDAGQAAARAGRSL